MRLRALAVTLAACALAGPAHAQQLASLVSTPELGGTLRFSFVADSIMRHVMHDQAIPGISVAIVKDGRVVMERGWGTTRHHEPATAGTVYQIASVTKQFTAAAILLLAEEGRIRLDEPVTRYVGGLSPVYEEVTIGALLNHTAGTPNFTEFMRRFREPLEPTRLVGALASRPLQFQPGSAFRYSNSGYYLLGLVIEQVTGQPYAGFLRDRFWAPLGMNDTRYCGAEDSPLPAGYGRNSRGDEVTTAPWHPSVLYAAGSVCSTVTDLAKWAVALGEGRVLRPESYRMMTTPAPSPDAHLRMTYGYGMMVDTTDAGPYFHHDGAIPGFRAQIAWYPQEHLAVVVLMNQGLAAPEPIERDLTRAVLGVAPMEPRLAGPRQPASTRAAAGSLPWPWREP